MNNMNNDYKRVIPRDLFNESKLLKCIGRLSLLIHDFKIPCKMGLGGPAMNGEPFKIALMDDNNLTISNLEISINKKLHIFKTTYNNKDNYPLFCQTFDYSEILVFDESGEFTQDFINYVKSI